MRSSIIFAALFSVLVSALCVDAQTTTSARLIRFNASNPGTDQEIIEALFEVPRRSRFVVKEASFWTETEEQCVAIRDFSTAVPVPPEQASIAGYKDVLKLKASLAPSPVVSNCRVLILDDGSVDGHDFLIWQRTFGSTGFADTGELEKIGRFEVNASASLIGRAYTIDVLPIR